MNDEIKVIIGAVDGHGQPIMVSAVLDIYGHDSDDLHVRAQELADAAGFQPHWTALETEPDAFCEAAWKKFHPPLREGEDNTHSKLVVLPNLPYKLLGTSIKLERRRYKAIWATNQPDWRALRKIFVRCGPGDASMLLQRGEYVMKSH